MEPFIFLAAAFLLLIGLLWRTRRRTSGDVAGLVPDVDQPDFDIGPDRAKLHSPRIPIIGGGKGGGGGGGGAGGGI